MIRMKRTLFVTGVRSLDDADRVNTLMSQCPCPSIAYAIDDNLPSPRLLYKAAAACNQEGVLAHHQGANLAHHHFHFLVWVSLDYLITGCQCQFPMTQRDFDAFISNDKITIGHDGERFDPRSYIVPASMMTWFMSRCQDASFRDEEKIHSWIYQKHADKYEVVRLYRDRSLFNELWTIDEPA